MPLFYYPHISDHFTLDDKQEVLHLTKVLRKKVGDAVFFTDGLGYTYEAQLLDFNPKSASFQVLEKQHHERLKPYVHIAVAPTKNIDRMEWFLEKATELGVDEVTFFKTAQSERKEIKNYERLHKCLISAIKQSQNPYLPKLNEMIDFKLFIAQSKSFQGERYIAYCKADKPIQMLLNHQSPRLFLVGPEGDFNAQEVQLSNEAGFQIVSLGSQILRTETAALALVIHSKWA